MRKICVWGTSLNKVADEAQVIAFIRIIKTRFPDTKVTLFSKYGDLMTKLMAKEGIEIETIRTAEIGKITRALGRSDLFVLEGGPFYEDPLQLARCLILFSIAKSFSLPVIAYGATAFYFKTWWGRFFFRHLFDRMDAITVREKIAGDIIKDLGIKNEVDLFADPRFILEPASPDEVQNILIEAGINIEEPIIGITTRHLHENVPAWVKRSHQYSDGRVENANEAIARTVAYLGGLGQLLLIPMHPSYDEDVTMAASVKKYMKDSSRLRMLSRRYNALEIMGIISQCELLFASRLGSAVFASVTATPLIAVAYEPRMIDHMERIGFGKNVFDWRSLKCKELVDKAREIWVNRTKIRDDMRSIVDKYKKIAWENSKELDRYLS